ncbi:MAG: recombinase family protein [Verrucomicrobia bacterium]|nr:recombinase family protein [Verrucomicrobiota bacterium]
MNPAFKSVSPTKQVGIWIRVSTEDQAQGDSPKHHELRARAYAESRGWTVCEVYDLAGVSGKSVVDHREAKRMMEDVRRGHIHALIFSKLARLARNTRELLDFSDFFREHDADLISLQESIDTTTPAGRLFYTMIAAMAQWEREEITERVKASVAVRARLGKPLSGRVAFGYHWKDGKIQPHPDEAPVRKLIYELFAQHKRKKAVARVLNDRGLRTRDGHKFTDTTVDRLIRDTTAKGQHRANFTRRVAGNKPWAWKPEHDWVINQVDPIVAEALWQQCNDLLDARRARMARPGKRPVHPFAGLVFCHCGKKMYVPSNTPKYVCSACRTKIPVIDLDGLFCDQLKDYLTAPDKISAYLDGANATLAEKTQLLETLRRDQTRTKQEAEKCFQLYNEGGLTAEQFKTRFQPLDQRRSQLEAELPRVEGEIDLLKVDGWSREHILAETSSIVAQWPTQTADEKRGIVESLVEKIVIKADEVTFNMRYLPDFKEMPEKQRTL